MLLLCGGLVVVFVVRKEIRSALLLLCAGAVLAPALLVLHWIWLGFDRYLYLAVLLAILALSESSLWTELGRFKKPLVAVLPFALVACAWSTWATSRSYASHQRFLGALMAQRPEDPSGRLMVARHLSHRGRRQEAGQLVTPLVDARLPPALARHLALTLALLHRHQESAAVIEAVYAREPADPYVQLDAFSLRLDQGRLDEAFRLAGQLRAYPSFCDVIRRLLLSRSSSRFWTQAQRVRGARFASGYRCGDGEEGARSPGDRRR
jgi:hypothetical protein